MSVYEVALGALSLGPRISATKEGLVARSSRALEFLTLFSWRKRIELDAARRVLGVTTWEFWFKKRRRDFAFEEIRYVWRTARRVPTALNLTGETNDRLESFQIWLELRTGEKVKLFSFLGEGSVKMGWKDTLLLGDDLVDLRGTQAEQSMAFAHQVAKLSGGELMDAPF
jgi:hypothetical protein